MRGVGDRGDERRIDHCRADAEQHAGDEPPAETARRRRQEQACRLRPHARDDQALAAPAVAQRPGRRLKDAPYGGIDGLEHADLLDAQPESGKEQRKNPPAHAVVQVVDQSGLRGREEIAVAERSAAKDFPEADRLGRLCVAGEFEAHVMARVAYEQHRQDEPERRIADAEVERRRPQPVALRDVSGEKGGDADRKIAGELVEADG